MRRLFCLGLFLVLLPGQQIAAEELTVDGQRLERTAQARACYLRLIELYDVDYFRATHAGDSGMRCVRVSYLRDFSAPMLDRATREIFEDLHGAEASARDRAWLERIGLAYQAVGAGDQYTYCVETPDAGVLIRDGREVARVASGDFAERFMQIWVASEDAQNLPRWRFNPC